MTKEELEACLAARLSLDQIARRVGRAPSTVSYHLKKHGLKPVGAKYASKGAVPRETLLRLVNAGATATEMARELDLSRTTVIRWLKRYGFWPLATGRRRAESRRARELGLKRADLECLRHGRTQFILESSGYHRCMQCRKEAVAEWRRRAKRRLVDQAGGACVLCGYDRSPAALEFHHLNPSEKAFGLSVGGLTRSLEKLRAEASKCVLLCANCHAEVEVGHTILPSEQAGT